MNSLLSTLGIESWKPVLSALALPPVPFLLLVLIGARLILPRRGLGWFVTLIGVTGLYLSACSGMGQLLQQYALRTPPALTAEAIAELKTGARGNKQTTAIVVLGGGVEPLAPEYRVSNLPPSALARLRYGLWLSRETGLPVAFSGGVGWGQQSDAQAEAQVAARIASHDFGRPLKWMEERSRDTRENAVYTLALLKPEGIKHIVLVTDASHMPRALREFRAVAQDSVTVQAAPTGLPTPVTTRTLDWLPSEVGFTQVRRALHELLGLLVSSQP